MEGISGNRGPDVRSDCYVSINTDGATNIKLTLKSKVKSLFGRQIEDLVLDILRYFEISKAEIFIEDSGALPYVIAARVESALKQFIHSDKEYLLPNLHQNLYSTDRFRQRRSRLYQPGDNPKQMINAGLYGADGIILDLEDSVAPAKKHDARYLVRNALRNNDFLGAERMVRINQSPAGLDDLPFIVPHHVNLILIPKCETANDVAAVDARIGELKTDKTRNIWLMPIIESAVGIINAYEIASASPNVVALAIGLEDYTADIGAERTSEGIESLYARSVIVNAARAAGIQPIDSVFSGFDDLVTLGQVASRSKSMGFMGMGCIHPAQIPVIHESFNPSQKEIEKAKRIVWAFEEAQKKGIGVIAIGSKMIDAPVVKRALHTIDQAVRNGLLNQNWRDNYEG